MIVSIRSSVVQLGFRMLMSALWILYSLQMAVAMSTSIWGRLSSARTQRATCQRRYNRQLPKPGQPTVALGGILERDTTLSLAAERDVRGLLVQADAEALQLALDDVFVSHGLAGVENDHDGVARERSTNNLATTTLSILSALNDTGQVQHLDLSALQDTNNGGSG